MTYGTIKLRDESGTELARAVARIRPLPHVIDGARKFCGHFSARATFSIAKLPEPASVRWMQIEIADVGIDVRRPYRVATSWLDAGAWPEDETPTNLTIDAPVQFNVPDDQEVASWPE